MVSFSTDRDMEKWLADDLNHYRLANKYDPVRHGVRVDFEERRILVFKKDGSSFD